MTFWSDYLLGFISRVDGRLIMTDMKAASYGFSIWNGWIRN